MHSDHGIFAEGLALKKRLKLTFFSKERGRNVRKVCAPLHYSKGKAHGDGLDCYYFWDYGAGGAGNHVMALSPMEILSMERTQEPFDIGEFTAKAGAGSARVPGVS